MWLTSLETAVGKGKYMQIRTEEMKETVKTDLVEIRNLWKPDQGNNKDIEEHQHRTS
jgi:hypothetical protein